MVARNKKEQSLRLSASEDLSNEQDRQRYVRQSLPGGGLSKYFWASMQSHENGEIPLAEGIQAFV